MNRRSLLVILVALIFAPSFFLPALMRALELPASMGGSTNTTMTGSLSSGGPTGGSTSGGSTGGGTTGSATGGSTGSGTTGGTSGSPTTNTTNNTANKDASKSKMPDCKPSSGGKTPSAKSNEAAGANKGCVPGDGQVFDKNIAYPGKCNSGGKTVTSIYKKPGTYTQNKAKITGSCADPGQFKAETCDGKPCTQAPADSGSSGSGTSAGGTGGGSSSTQTEPEKQQLAKEKSQALAKETAKDILSGNHTEVAQKIADFKEKGGNIEDLRAELQKNPLVNDSTSPTAQAAGKEALRQLTPEQSILYNGTPPKDPLNLDSSKFSPVTQPSQKGINSLADNAFLRTGQQPTLQQALDFQKGGQSILGGAMSQPLAFKPYFNPQSVQNIDSFGPASGGSGSYDPRPTYTPTNAPSGYPTTFTQGPVQPPSDRFQPYTANTPTRVSPVVAYLDQAKSVGNSLLQTWDTIRTPPPSQFVPEAQPVATDLSASPNASPSASQSGLPRDTFSSSKLFIRDDQVINQALSGDPVGWGTLHEIQQQSVPNATGPSAGEQSAHEFVTKQLAEGVGTSQPPTSWVNQQLGTLKAGYEEIKTNLVAARDAMFGSPSPESLSPEGQKSSPLVDYMAYKTAPTAVPGIVGTGVIPGGSPGNPFLDPKGSGSYSDFSWRPKESGYAFQVGASSPESESPVFANKGTSPFEYNPESPIVTQGADLRGINPPGGESPSFSQRTMLDPTPIASQTFPNSPVPTGDNLSSGFLTPERIGEVPIGLTPATLPAGSNPVAVKTTFEPAGTPLYDSSKFAPIKEPGWGDVYLAKTGQKEISSGIYDPSSFVTSQAPLQPPTLADTKIVSGNEVAAQTLEKYNSINDYLNNQVQEKSPFNYDSASPLVQQANLQPLASANDLKSAQDRLAAFDRDTANVPTLLQTPQLMQERAAERSALVADVNTKIATYQQSADYYKPFLSDPKNIALATIGAQNEQYRQIAANTTSASERAAAYQALNENNNLAAGLVAHPELAPAYLSVPQTPLEKANRQALLNSTADLGRQLQGGLPTPVTAQVANYVRGLVGLDPYPSPVQQATSFARMAAGLDAPSLEYQNYIDASLNKDYTVYNTTKDAAIAIDKTITSAQESSNPLVRASGYALAPFGYAANLVTGLEASGMSAFGYAPPDVRLQQMTQTPLEAGLGRVADVAITAAPFVSPVPVLRAMADPAGALSRAGTAIRNVVVGDTGLATLNKITSAAIGAPSASVTARPFNLATELSRTSPSIPGGSAAFTAPLKTFSAQELAAITSPAGRSATVALQNRLAMVPRVSSGVSEFAPRGAIPNAANYPTASVITPNQARAMEQLNTLTLRGASNAELTQVARSAGLRIEGLTTPTSRFLVNDSGQVVARAGYTIGDRASPLYRTTSPIAQGASNLPDLAPPTVIPSSVRVPESLSTPGASAFDGVVAGQRSVVTSITPLQKAALLGDQIWTSAKGLVPEFSASNLVRTTGTLTQLGNAAPALATEVRAVLTQTPAAATQVLSTAQQTALRAVPSEVAVRQAATRAVAQSLPQIARSPVVDFAASRLNLSPVVAPITASVFSPSTVAVQPTQVSSLGTAPTRGIVSTGNIGDAGGILTRTDAVSVTSQLPSGGQTSANVPTPPSRPADLTTGSVGTPNPIGSGVVINAAKPSNVGVASNPATQGGLQFAPRPTEAQLSPAPSEPRVYLATKAPDGFNTENISHAFWVIDRGTPAASIDIPGVDPSQQYVTLSGQPQRDPVSGFFSPNYLIKQLNSPSDLRAVLDGTAKLAEIPTPAGVTPVQYVQNLVGAFNRMPEVVAPYGLLGTNLPGQANSNNFATQLGADAGISPQEVAFHAPLLVQGVAPGLGSLIPTLPNRAIVQSPAGLVSPATASPLANAGIPDGAVIENEPISAQQLGPQASQQTPAPIGPSASADRGFLGRVTAALNDPVEALNPFGPAFGKNIRASSCVQDVAGCLAVQTGEITYYDPSAGGINCAKGGNCSFTASGERFNARGMTIASKLPINTVVKITVPGSAPVYARVNDIGGFTESRPFRIADLVVGVARLFGMGPGQAGTQQASIQPIGIYPSTAVAARVTQGLNNGLTLAAAENGTRAVAHAPGVAAVPLPPVRPTDFNTPVFSAPLPGVISPVVAGQGAPSGLNVGDLARDTVPSLSSGISQTTQTPAISPSQAPALRPVAPQTSPISSTESAKTLAALSYSAPSTPVGRGQSALQDMADLFSLYPAITGSALVSPAEARPRTPINPDRQSTAIAELYWVTKALSEVYGIAPEDVPALAQGINGVFFQEASGNPDVWNSPTSKFAGPPQTSLDRAAENASMARTLARNTDIPISAENRKVLEDIANRLDAIDAARLDARKDLYTGPAMLVMQMFSLDPQGAPGITSGQGEGFTAAVPALRYARNPDGTLNPQKISAFLQTTQICPTCTLKYSQDPKNAKLDAREAKNLSNSGNRVAVKEGDLVTDSFDKMLTSKKNYNVHFAAGINKMNQYLYGQAPAATQAPSPIGPISFMTTVEGVLRDASNAARRIVTGNVAPRPTQTTQSTAPSRGLQDAFADAQRGGAQVEEAFKNTILHPWDTLSNIGSFLTSPFRSTAQQGAVPVGCAGGTCVRLDVPCKDQSSCYVSPRIAEKVKNLHIEASVQEARVTEAVPNTRVHRSPTQANGTSVDYGKAGGMTPDEIIRVIAAAEANGLRPVYEVQTASQKNSLVQAGVPKDSIAVVGGWITAPHFSIYDRAGAGTQVATAPTVPTPPSRPSQQTIDELADVAAPILVDADTVFPKILIKEPKVVVSPAVPKQPIQPLAFSNLQLGAFNGARGQFLPQLESPDVLPEPIPVDIGSFNPDEPLVIQVEGPSVPTPPTRPTGFPSNAPTLPSRPDDIAPAAEPIEAPGLNPDILVMEPEAVPERPAVLADLTNPFAGKTIASLSGTPASFLPQLTQPAAPISNPFAGKVLATLSGTQPSFLPQLVQLGGPSVPTPPTRPTGFPSNAPIPPSRPGDLAALAQAEVQAAADALAQAQKAANAQLAADQARVAAAARAQIAAEDTNLTRAQAQEKAAQAAREKIAAEDALAQTQKIVNENLAKIQEQVAQAQRAQINAEDVQAARDAAIVRDQAASAEYDRLAAQAQTERQRLADIQAQADKAAADAQLAEQTKAAAQKLADAERAQKAAADAQAAAKAKSDAAIREYDRLAAEFQARARAAEAARLAAQASDVAPPATVEEPTYTAPEPLVIAPEDVALSDLAAAQSPTLLNPLADKLLSSPLPGQTFPVAIPDFLPTLVRATANVPVPPLRPEYIGSILAPAELVKSPNLRVGSRGEMVAALQAYLFDQGYKLRIDGIFGPETKQALSDWQIDNDIDIKTADLGNFGPITRSAIVAQSNAPATPAPTTPSTPSTPTAAPTTQAPQAAPAPAATPQDDIFNRAAKWLGNLLNPVFGPSAPQAAEMKQAPLPLTEATPVIDLVLKDAVREQFAQQDAAYRAQQAARSPFQKLLDTMSYTGTSWAGPSIADVMQTSVANAAAEYAKEADLACAGFGFNPVGTCTVAMAGIHVLETSNLSVNENSTATGADRANSSNLSQVTQATAPAVYNALINNAAFRARFPYIQSFNDYWAALHGSDWRVGGVWSTIAHFTLDNAGRNLNNQNTLQQVLHRYNKSETYPSVVRNNMTALLGYGGVPTTQSGRPQNTEMIRALMGTMNNYPAVGIASTYVAQNPMAAAQARANRQFALAQGRQDWTLALAAQGVQVDNTAYGPGGVQSAPVVVSPTPVAAPDPALVQKKTDLQNSLTALKTSVQAAEAAQARAVALGETAEALNPTLQGLQAGKSVMQAAGEIANKAGDQQLASAAEELSGKIDQMIPVVQGGIANPLSLMGSSDQLARGLRVIFASGKDIATRAETAAGTEIASIDNAIKTAQAAPAAPLAYAPATVPAAAPAPTTQVVSADQAIKQTVAGLQKAFQCGGSSCNSLRIIDTNNPVGVPAEMAEWIKARYANASKSVSPNLRAAVIMSDYTACTIVGGACGTVTSAAAQREGTHRHPNMYAIDIAFGDGNRTAQADYASAFINAAHELGITPGLGIGPTSLHVDTIGMRIGGGAANAWAYGSGATGGDAASVNLNSIADPRLREIGQAAFNGQTVRTALLPGASVQVASNPRGAVDWVTIGGKPAQAAPTAPEGVKALKAGSPVPTTVQPGITAVAHDPTTGRTYVCSLSPEQCQAALPQAINADRVARGYAPDTTLIEATPGSSEIPSTVGKPATPAPAPTAYGFASLDNLPERTDPLFKKPLKEISFEDKKAAITKAFDAITDMWQQSLASVGISYRKPVLTVRHIVMITNPQTGETYESGSRAMNPNPRNPTGSIDIGVDTSLIPEGATLIDLIMMMSHEIGHTAEYALGVRGEADGVAPNASMKQVEHVADMLGARGMLAKYPDGTPILAAGDVEHLQKGMASTPTQDGHDPHGTGEERAELFKRGFAVSNDISALFKGVGLQPRQNIASISVTPPVAPVPKFVVEDYIGEVKVLPQTEAEAPKLAWDATTVKAPSTVAQAAPVTPEVSAAAQKPAQVAPANLFDQITRQLMPLGNALAVLMQLSLRNRKTGTLTQPPVQQQTAGDGVPPPTPEEQAQRIAQIDADIADLARQQQLAEIAVVEKNGGQAAFEALDPAEQVRLIQSDATFADLTERISALSEEVNVLEAGRAIAVQSDALVTAATDAAQGGFNAVLRRETPLDLITRPGGLKVALRDTFFSSPKTKLAVIGGTLGGTWAISSLIGGIGSGTQSAPADAAAGGAGAGVVGTKPGAASTLGDANAGKPLPTYIASPAHLAPPGAAPGVTPPGTVPVPRPQWNPTPGGDPSYPGMPSYTGYPDQSGYGYPMSPWQQQQMQQQRAMQQQQARQQQMQQQAQQQQALQNLLRQQQQQQAQQAAQQKNATPPTIQFFASPSTVALFASTTLQWTSTNTTSCYIFDPAGNLVTQGAQSGSYPIAAVTQTTTYGLTCTSYSYGQNTYATTTVMIATSTQSSGL